MKTIIQLDKETVDKLKRLKEYNRQSYDEVINKHITDIDEEPLTKEEIEGIKRSLENIKQGKVTPIEEVAKELGIKL